MAAIIVPVYVYVPSDSNDHTSVLATLGIVGAVVLGFWVLLGTMFAFVERNDADYGTGEIPGFWKPLARNIFLAAWVREMLS